MYVAVKGGEKAIDAAHELLAEKRRGDRSLAALDTRQIEQQLKLSVDRVMAEGSLYDPPLAALAIKQAQGDLVEAAFLIRAYRSTLPRLATGVPVDITGMRLERRISATFKDLPGGQLLGPTYDYTHRLLDFRLMADGDVTEDAQDKPSATDETAPETQRPYSPAEGTPSVASLLRQQDLMETLAGESNSPAPDLSRDPLEYPTDRRTRLQALARGDEGFLLALGYSTQRGYGRNHPFAGEIRQGLVSLCIVPEELGFEIDIGDLELTECCMVNQFSVQADGKARLSSGYGLVFGNNERKAMAMALVDRSLRIGEFDESADSPAQQEEFVLSHCDNVEASGFVSHLKLPHYVDFQSELELLRRLRKENQE